MKKKIVMSGLICLFLGNISVSNAMNKRDKVSRLQEELHHCANEFMVISARSLNATAFEQRLAEHIVTSQEDEERCVSKAREAINVYAKRTRNLANEVDHKVSREKHQLGPVALDLRQSIIGAAMDLSEASAKIPTMTYPITKAKIVAAAAAYKRSTSIVGKTTIEVEVKLHEAQAAVYAADNAANVAELRVKTVSDQDDPEVIETLYKQTLALQTAEAAATVADKALHKAEKEIIKTNRAVKFATILSSLLGLSKQ